MRWGGPLRLRACCAPLRSPAAPPRLQELEDQYRREREEATYLLEQQRLVRTWGPALPAPLAQPPLLPGGA